ncbi:MAG TPA: DUF4345 domain-containing protein [Candidatus Binatia bacterium]|jgi:hypothetical protein|nr:DUF4345 domain-containing protein [Candidatus Binatia bacterium]
MNGRIVAGLVGLGIVAFGLMGLFYPVQVMSIAGFSPASESMRAQAYGETRAIYGGTFIALGIYTIFAASNPIVHRRTLTMMAMVFFGILAGRMIGISIDGNPGLFGWIGAGLEVSTGSLLLASTYLHRVPEALPPPQVD